MMVRRDRGRGGVDGIRRGRARTRGGHARPQAGRQVRTLDPRRHCRRLGPVGAAPRAPGRAVPRRLLHPRADDPFCRGPHQPGPPAADELVPLPRAGFAAVPALPEPALHDGRVDRHGGRPRHRVPLVPLPPPGAVAGDRVLERSALRAEPLDGGRRCGRLTLPRLGSGHRIRVEGLRLGGIRRVDPALGVVDPAPRLGLHLPRPVVAAASLFPPSSSSC